MSESARETSLRDEGSVSLREASLGRRRRVMRVSLAMVAAVATACSGGDDDPERTTTTRQQETTVSVPGSESVPTTSVSVPPLTTEGSSGPSPVTTEAPAGDFGWNTQPESSDVGLAEDLYKVDIGQHEGYDRISFTVNGAVPGEDIVGYDVRYVNGDVGADGSGEPVPTAGDATLQIVVRAPAQGYNPASGHQPGRMLAPSVGHDFYPEAELADWKTFRDVSFAGSFEGQTTFAVGLDEQAPFAVNAHEIPGQERSVVYVDIQH